MAEERVTLASIGNGAALELFERELSNVIENIADINTKAQTNREINLKITITPDEDRTVAFASLEVTSKLAGTKPVKGVLYFGRDKETKKLVAVTSNVAQPSIFDDPAQSTVEPIRLVGNRGGDQGGAA